MSLRSYIIALCTYSPKERRSVSIKSALQLGFMDTPFGREGPDGSEGSKGSEGAKREKVS